MPNETKEKKKWAVNPPQWVEAPKESPKLVPDGTVEIVKMESEVERYIVEILSPCMVSGKTAQPGERYLMHANDAGSVCFAMDPLGEPRAKIVEVIPATPSARIQKLSQA